MRLHTFIVLVSLLLASGASAGVAAEAKAAAEPAQRDEVRVRTAEDPEDAYAIGIGDVLEITVWKNPELSVTAPVRPDGRISVPLLGDVQAEGMTPLALKQVLTDGYKEFVTAPSVSVVIKEINSQKVFVTGEVEEPGAYDIRPRTKLMQVVAMAGGVTPYAKGRAIVLRDRGGRDRRFEIELSAHHLGPAAAGQHRARGRRYRRPSLSRRPRRRYCKTYKPDSTALVPRGRLAPLLHFRSGVGSSADRLATSEQSSEPRPSSGPEPPSDHEEKVVPTRGWGFAPPFER